MEEEEEEEEEEEDERARDYMLALESGTYTEYLMKRDLHGFRHGNPLCSEDEFKEAHECLDEHTRIFPALRDSTVNWPWRRNLARLNAGYYTRKRKKEKTPWLMDFWKRRQGTTPS